MGRLCGQLYSWMMDAEEKSLTLDQSGTPVNSSYHKQVAKQKGREHRPEALALCRKLGYINSRSNLCSTLIPSAVLQSGPLGGLPK